MFFDELAQIPEIAKRGGTSVFVVPEGAAVELPRNWVVLQPEEKTTITIEQVRQATARLGMRQTSDQFVAIMPAEKLGLAAANALLKSLEEPGEQVHYALVTGVPSLLPATILSRAAVYIWREMGKFSLEIEAEEEMKTLAKRLIAAKPADLVEVAEMAAKKKPAREYALQLLGLTIEILYKSYFITGKEAFVRKIPGVLRAYENISRNGHVKLHMVADLV